jgi:hypothetical protein
MLENERSSETSVTTYETTRRHNQKTILPQKVNWLVYVVDMDDENCILAADYAELIKII